MDHRRRKNPRPLLVTVVPSHFPFAHPPVVSPAGTVVTGSCFAAGTADGTGFAAETVAVVAGAEQVPLLEQQDDAAPRRAASRSRSGPAETDPADTTRQAMTASRKGTFDFELENRMRIILRDGDGRLKTGEQTCSRLSSDMLGSRIGDATPPGMVQVVTTRGGKKE